VDAVLREQLGDGNIHEGLSVQRGESRNSRYLITNTDHQNTLPSNESICDHKIESTAIL
jgi:hypothetical protein